MSEKKKNIIGMVLFLGFVVMFLAGAVSGESSTVLTKAVNICLECIGIG